MYDTLAIQLPGDVRQMLNRTPEEMARDLRLYAGLMLFRLGKLSSGAAADMAGVPLLMFLDLCPEYDIPVSQITAERSASVAGGCACWSKGCSANGNLRVLPRRPG
ncbi:UPF0175 family protein [Candidatus Amarolinea dominans]|uniref:UPF0175 family protein n=1 Tax=Candidatus Amarolinea dominans TaxID=3140696 RepID=UPI0031357872|nr:UPF0175 family protein [Anaerolineae bacterium]